MERARSGRRPAGPRAFRSTRVAVFLTWCLLSLHARIAWILPRRRHGPTYVRRGGGRPALGRAATLKRPRGRRPAGANRELRASDNCCLPPPVLWSCVPLATTVSLLSTAS